VVTIGVLGYESDCSRKKEYFCHELKKYFNNCQAEDAKELPKRVEELLRHFAGDTLTVGASRVICHEFQDVVSKPSNGRIFPVRARLHKGSWMCQVAHDSVKEDDIRVFLNDVKEEKTKVIKKVLVAISGSELNAVLTAKNANIAIWDLKNLNQLMDVYDRPKVIV
jgi:hypothetical protein